MAAENDNLNSLNQDNNISAMEEAPKTADQVDLLNIGDYYKSVVYYVEHANTPISIALDGKIGSGKTSLMYEIKDKLCDGNDAKFYSVWINTWQFSLLDPNSGFKSKQTSQLSKASDSNKGSQAVIRILQSIVNQIIVLKPDYERRDQIAKIMGSIAIISTNLKLVSDKAGDPLFGVGKASLGVVAKTAGVLKNFFSNKADTSSDDNAALVSQLSIEIQKLVDEVLEEPQKVRDIHVQQFVPFDPFEASDWTDRRYCFWTRLVWGVLLFFCNIFPMIGFAIYNIALAVFNIANILLTRSWFLLKDFWLNFCCYMGKVFCAVILGHKMPAKNKRKGFIFFIDDLDRLEPQFALQILITLSNVFSFKKCIFILAVDRAELIKSIRNIDFTGNESQSEFNNFYRQHYLDRIVNVSIDAPDDVCDVGFLLRNYLKTISFFTCEELEDKDLFSSLKNIVTYASYNNPRLIKKLVNNLSFLKTFKDFSLSDGGEQWQASAFIKEIAMALLFIKDICPDVYYALFFKPYFKQWNLEFAQNYFDEFKYLTELSESHNINKEAVQQALGNKVTDLECALFLFCKSNRLSKQQFYKVIEILSVISKDFDKYIKNRSLSSSMTECEIYEGVFTKVFFLFFRKMKIEQNCTNYHAYLAKILKIF